MQHHIPLAVALVGAIVACSDPSTAPADVGAPSLASANAPPQSGPIVSRFTLGFGFLPSPEEGVSLTFGLESTPGGLCAGTEDLVTSPGVEQNVATPSGNLQILAKSREAKLVLYAEATTDFCELADIAILGTGTGTLQVTLSNIDVAGPGVTTFVERVRGTVTLVGGGAVEVRLFNIGVIRPDGTVLHEQRRFTLTPVATP